MNITNRLLFLLIKCENPFAYEYCWFSCAAAQIIILKSGTTTEISLLSIAGKFLNEILLNILNAHDDIDGIFPSVFR